MGWFKSVLDWIGRFQVIQSVFGFLKPIIWPFGLAAMTGGAGILNHQPIMWVIMASALVFMAIVVSLYFGASYSIAKTPNNKLRYIGTLVMHDLTPENRLTRRAKSANNSAILTTVRAINKVQIGVQLHNIANFPISVYLKSAETTMQGKAPPRSIFPKPSVTIVPGNAVILVDDPIDVGGLACGKIEGSMDIAVKYGLPGKEIYELRFKGKVDALFLSNGFLQSITTQWDSNLPQLPSPR
jgi:hypothetical protein